MLITAPRTQFTGYVQIIRRVCGYLSCRCVRSFAVSSKRFGISVLLLLLCFGGVVCGVVVVVVVVVAVVVFIQWYDCHL